MPENNDALIDIKFNVDEEQLKGNVKKAADAISAALSGNISKIADKFAKDLGKNIQVQFDDAVLKSLKKPIVLKLDTTDAAKKVSKLIAPIAKVAAKSTSTGRSAASKSTSQGLPDQSELERIRGNFTNVLSSLRSEFRDLGAAAKPFDDELNKIGQSLKGLSLSGRGGTFSEAEAQRVLKVRDSIIKVSESFEPFRRITTSALKETRGNIDGLENEIKLVNRALAEVATQGAADETTKNLTKNVSKLREAYNLLSDEAKKTEPNLRLVNRTLRNIEDIEDKSRSALKTIQEDRDNALRVTVDAFEKEKAAISQAQQEQADKDKETRRRITREQEKDRDAAFSRRLKQEMSNAEKLREFNRRADEEDRKAIEKVRQDNQDKAFINQSSDRLTGAGGTRTFDSLTRRLNQARQEATKVNGQQGADLLFVTRATKNYDSALINLEKRANAVNEEFRKGNLTLEQARKKFINLEREVDELSIGIDQVAKNNKRFKDSFDLQEADPSKLAFRFGILGFTLQAVGGRLTNFSRNLFQLFDQLGQFAEPIERVRNQLSLLTQAGEITGEQQEVILNRLRSIGDLPGSSVEDANATFNALQKVNLSLKERLDLTEGIAKIPASLGGTAESAKRFSDAIAAISLETTIDDERFRTLRRSGGRVVANLLDELNIRGGADIEEFGVTNLITRLGEELKKLEEPAATTSDRVNRLKSRASELGVILGQVLAPGLDNLNSFLKNEITPTVNSLSMAFKSLSDEQRTAISNFAIAIPVVTAIAGAFLTFSGITFFVISSLGQFSKISKTVIPILKEKLDLIKALPAAFAGTNTALSGVNATANSTIRTLGPIRNALANIFLATAAGGRSAGIVATLSTVGAGVRTIGVGLSRVLSLLGPVGIAIQLLLSSVISFFTNFNGIRDRLFLAFGELDEAVRDLSNELGFGPNGILKILTSILGVVGTIFDTVGSFVLDVLVSVAKTVADILNNITDIIKQLRQGDLLGAFGSAVRLLFNGTVGLLKTLVIELLATLGDGIASLIDQLPGPNVGVADGIRTVTDSFRTLNGTDRESVFRRNETLRAQQQLDDFRKQQQDVLDTEEERRKAAERRNVELQQKSDELIRKIEKDQETARQNFIKFQDEQERARIQQRIDSLRNSSSEIVSTFKEQSDTIDSLSNLSTQYNDVIDKLDANQRRLIQSTNELGFNKALTEFRSLASNTGPLREIFEIAELGVDSRYINIADAIKDVASSETQAGLTESLQLLENLAGDNTSVLNAIEKTRSVLANVSRDNAKLINDYKKILKDLRKVEIDRRANIQIEIRNRELEARQRQFSLQNRITSGNRSISDAQIADRSKLSNFSIDQDFNRKIADIRNEFNNKIDSLNTQLLNAETKFSADVAAGRVAFGVNDTAEIRKLRADIVALQKEADVAVGFLQADRDVALRVNNENIISRLLTSLRNLNIVGESVTNNLIDGITSIGESARSLLFGTLKDPDTANNLFNLNEEIDRLVKNGEIAESSNLYKELKNVLKELAMDTITAAEAQERFIKILTSSEITEFVNKELDAQKRFDQLIENRPSLGTPIRDIQSSDDLALLTARLLQARDGVSDPSSLSVDIPTDGLKKSLLEFTTKSNDNALNAVILSVIEDIENDPTNLRDATKKIFEIINQNAVNFPQRAEIVLTALLSDTNIKKLLGADGEILLAAIEKLNATRERTRKELEVTIRNNIKTVDSQLVIRQEEFLKKEKDFTKDLELIRRQRLDAGSKEQRMLIDKENKILASLIKYKFDKLLVEEDFNTRKEIIQANGNKREIERIREESQKRIEEIKKARNNEITEFVVANGGSRNEKGELVDSEGNVIKENTSTSEKIIGEVNKINSAIDGVRNGAVEAGNAVLQLFDRIARGDNVINKFKGLLGGTKFSLGELKDTFIDLAKTGVAAFGQALGQAIAEVLLNGGNFLKNLGKFFGDILIQLGVQLVQLGTAALALAALGTFFPLLKGITGGPEGVAAGVTALGVGAGLILAGKALGGGGDSSGATASNTNASNTSDSSSGVGGDAFDPQREIEIFQKQQRVEIALDVRSDDSRIIKGLIKGVNRSAELRNLVGNSSTNIRL